MSESAELQSEASRDEAALSAMLSAVRGFEEWQGRVARQGSRHVHSLFPVLLHFRERRAGVYREADDERYMVRYFDVGRSDHTLPFFDPFVQTWLTAGYAHSNVATIRKKTFALAWKACEWDSGTNHLALAADCVGIFANRALAKAGRRHPIPFASFAIWFSGMDALSKLLGRAGSGKELPDLAGDIDADAETMRRHFGLSAVDMGRLFDLQSSPAPEYTRLMDDLSSGGLRLGALGAALVQHFPVETGPQAPPAPEGSSLALLELGLDLEQLAEDFHFPLEALQEISWGLRSKRALVLAGPPGSGKTFIAKRLAAQIAADRVTSIQFHPGYSYESFVSGYKPSLGATGNLTYTLAPGPLLRVAAAARETPDQLHILLIDELNRANVPAVFGELLSALEYRDEPVELQYGDPFGQSSPMWAFPPNVLVIATMNNVDRSAGQLDSAVRRRFAFVDVNPGRPPFDTTFTSYIRAQWTDGSRDWVGAWLTALNETLPNPEFAIGVSYFVNSSLTELELGRIVRQEIRPYLAAHYDLSVHPAVEAHLDFVSTEAYAAYHPDVARGENQINGA